MHRRSFLRAGALIAGNTGAAQLARAQADARDRAAGLAEDVDAGMRAMVGTAQDAAKAAEAAAASVDIRRVTEIDALKSLNTDVTKLAFLPGNTGFDWKDVDSEAGAALDPNEHMIVRDRKKPLSAGAWYRRLKGEEPGVRDAFKAKGDGRSDDTAALQDAIHWMEYYPARSRALTFERGIYNISQLKVPDHILGISFNGRSFWDSSIVCQDGGNEPAIRNMSQEFKLFDLSLLSALPNTENWKAEKNGLQNEKPHGQTVDVDVTISRCRIAGFYNGVYHKGRGLAAHNNHFASCHYGIGLDWPDESDYKATSDDIARNAVAGDAMGFRGIAISNTRFHSLNYAAVANVGQNASKIVGLKINDLMLDIGRRIFHGHLGTHGSIANCTSTLSATEILELTGGRDFNVAGITGGGNAKKGTRTPKNLIKLSDGLFIGGRFSGMVLSNCEEHAILDRAACLQGISFSDITFNDIGFDAPDASRAFSFGSQNSDIEVSNTKLVGEDRLQGIIGNNYSNNRVRAVNLSRQGSETPWASGSPVVIVGKRQNYTPELVPVTNISRASASVFEWLYVDDDVVEIGGRVVAAGSESGNCELDVSVPVPSIFTQLQQGWGSLIAVTNGLNIAGSVVASGTMLRLRWLAPATDANSFSFSARYRVM